jgi:hypothetical protein
MRKFAVVVQTFIKSDTLDALGKSLLACQNRHRFDLIFWSDSATGARKAEEYLAKTNVVRNQLELFAGTQKSEFQSIDLRGNLKNWGTCKTCEIALNNVFEDHDFVVFTEDDTIFTRDALDWFVEMSESSAFLDDNVWAIAGESIFFDGRHSAVHEGIVSRLSDHAQRNEFWNKYIPLDFIPSTCFATNRDKWRQFASTRGQPVGDVDLCRRCRDEGKKCLFPIVARVKDVGMLHPDGYSVSVHSAQGITSVKNCYLMSDQIYPRTIEPFEPFVGDVGLLYAMSVVRCQDPPRDEEDGKSGSTSRTIPPPHLLEAARSAGLGGDWGLALKLWTALKQQEPPTIEIGANIGLCLLKLGRNRMAKAAIDEALALAPEEPYAQSILAYILEADGDFNDAAKIWHRLLLRNDISDWLSLSAVNGSARCAASQTPPTEGNANENLPPRSE